MRRGAWLLLLFVGLAVLHTWPLAGDVSGLSRLDNDDAGLNVFIVSWVAHILPRAPLSLFDAPMFFPERYTLAYSEHMLVPSLMGAPLLWAGVSPITAYNILLLAGFTLSGWSMALVVSRWTGHAVAGVVAGSLYAFNAHLLTRLVHLQALHIEFLPFALLWLDEILRQPQEPTARHLAASAAASRLAAAFVLQALCSNYTLVFLAVALVVAALVRAREWLWPLRLDRVGALVLAGLISTIVVAPFLWPYYVVGREQGLSRPVEEVALYSAGWRDYLATGGRLHYEWWSHRVFEGRTPLFPGVAALALASIALLTGHLRKDPRVRMMAGIGLVGLALSFGPALPGYAWLHEHVPLFQGLRGAARWGLLPLTAVAVLAGFTVAAWDRQWRGSAYRMAGLLSIVALITIEALRAPMGFVGVPVIPAMYDTFAADREAVLVEIPIYSGVAVSENAQYLVNATRHFRPLANGYSGFETAGFRDRAARWRAFPAPEVLDEMRQLGITRIVVHVDEVSETQVAALDRTSGLTLIRDDGPLRLYRLDRPPVGGRSGPGASLAP